MRTVKKYLRTIALILVMIILLQNCTVYKNTSVSLNQAAQNETKVKVKTKNEETLKFKRIALENGTYYGVEKNKDKMSKVSLDPNIILSIHEKDRPTSTLFTVMTVAGSLFVILAGISVIVFVTW